MVVHETTANKGTEITDNSTSARSNTGHFWRQRCLSAREPAATASPGGRDGGKLGRQRQSGDGGARRRREHGEHDWGVGGAHPMVHDGREYIRYSQISETALFQGNSACLQESRKIWAMDFAHKGQGLAKAQGGEGDLWTLFNTRAQQI